MRLSHPGAPRRSPTAGLLVFVAALALAAVPAARAAAPVGGPGTLAVSVPPDPVAIIPGGDSFVAIRVVNPGVHAVTTTISPRSLSFGNNGKVELGTEPDPRWRGILDYPRTPLRIPARGYRDVRLRLHVPARLTPDLYFVGFVVTPQASSAGNIKVINQIGSFVTLDVLGPRLRQLEAAFHVGSIVVGSRAHGSVWIGNTGRTAIRFWGETDTSSAPGGKPSEQRLDASLLPRGTSRTVAVSGTPAWPIGVVTMTVRLVYPGRTEAATKQLVLTKRVLVVNPIAFGAGLLLLAAAAVAVVLAVRVRGGFGVAANRE